MSLETLYHNLRKFRERRRLKQILENLREAAPQDFEAFLTYFLQECHVTKPKFLEGEAAQQAEGRRRLAMGILDLLAMDEPTRLILQIEKQIQKEEEEQRYAG